MILKLEVNIPDDKVTGVLADFVHYHGYQDKISTIVDNEEVQVDNPQTKAQFAKTKVAEFIKNSVKSYRANISAEEARIAKIEEVEAISIV